MYDVNRFYSSKYLFKPSFQQYMDQIPETKRGSERFLRNWTKAKDGKGRIQPMGTNKVRMLAKDVAMWLYGEISNKSYTTHSFRRSAATALAEAGTSVVALCHAGRWGSLVTAQEYQEHTGYEKRERAMMLDKGESTEIIVHKKQKHNNSDEVPKQPSVVQGNCTVINIGSCNGGTISFLNGRLSSESAE